MEFSAKSGLETVTIVVVDVGVLFVLLAVPVLFTFVDVPCTIPCPSPCPCGRTSPWDVVAVRERGIVDGRSSRDEEGTEGLR